MNLSPTMLGRIGVSLLEQLAAQAMITANQSFHDEKGWDVMLQLPSGDQFVGPLDHLPPGLSCMVQVKTTTTSDTAEPIKLSNWQRMCSDPIPWFVFIVRVDPDALTPVSAHLVLIARDWCAAALRRLRELSAEGAADLHKRHLNVRWSDDDQLSELHGRELARKIRAAVPDQIAHVAEKIKWYRDLGYQDRGRRVKVTMTGDRDAILGQLADVAIGQQRYFPKGWIAMVSDVRFGVEAQLTSFDASAGEMEYHPGPQGKVELVLESSGGRRAVITGDVYRARTAFSFLPEEFDRVRVVDENVSALLVPVRQGDEYGWLTNFEFAIPREPTALGKLRVIADAASVFLDHGTSPFTLTVKAGGTPVQLIPGTPEAPPPDLHRVVTTIDAALAVCASFDVPTTTAVSVELLEDQEVWLDAIRSMLDADEGGELVSPYREVVPLGTLFGTIQEVALHLNDRTLVLLVGAYGRVSECQEIAGKGAMLTVADGRLIRHRVVTARGSDDSQRIELQSTLRRELLTAGCTLILEPEEYKRLMKTGGEPDGADEPSTVG